MCGGGEISPNLGGSVDRARSLILWNSASLPSRRRRVALSSASRTDEELPVVLVRDLRQLGKNAVPRPSQGKQLDAAILGAG